MRKFNKVITVEVSIDSIAQTLLSNMKDDFKHRELVVEGIITRMMDSEKSMSVLYNTLHGHTMEINFEVGEIVCPSNLRVFDYSEGESKRVDVKEAKVVSIDVFADKQLEVEYTYMSRSGDLKTEKSRVDATSCSKIPTVAVEV